MRAALILLLSIMALTGCAPPDGADARFFDPELARFVDVMTRNEAMTVERRDELLEELAEVFDAK